MSGKREYKKGMAGMLAVAMAMANLPVPVVNAKEAEGTEVPKPVYSWDFETNDFGEARLEGKASIVNDSIKGNVLDLPGGSAGAGSMELPSELFSKLGNDGFTISMWVKASPETTSYTKYFNASNSPLGESYSGNHWWSTPDFALAAGGDVYDMTLYVGAPGESTGTATKLKYDEHLKKGAWQHVAVTVSKEEYAVYFNGKKVTYQDAQDNTKSVKDVLPALFKDNYLQTLTYASIGKSQYTSDNDFKGKVDDVNFYSSALTEKEVASLFESYGDIINKREPVSMTVDLAQKTGKIKHGATGFLYGIGDDNVPSTNLLTAIKPRGCEQKPANGLQHPSGDFLEIADTFLSSGGDFIQIACPDIYANWPYEFESIPEYLEKLKTMVQQVKDAGYSDSAVYVPFNEADGNWYTEIWSGDSTGFLKAWKQAYDTIKAVDPNAKIAGSNMCCFHGDHMKDFVKFCAENDCIPDQITWHVLNSSLYNNFPRDVKTFREYEKEYWLDTKKTTEKKEIVINEYADFTELGVPGELTSWLGLFEDEKVTACLAYWHIANNLSDIAADTNEPNGAWWLYKWYADMSGQTVGVSTSGAAKTDFYGVASLDENKKSANVLLGGVDKDITLTLKNVASTSCFGKKVKVRLESTNWTGINGAIDGTKFIREEICPVDENGNVTIKIDNMVAASAYNVSIAQADDNATVGVVTDGEWSNTYEGEDAILAGGAKRAGKDSKYACSGTGQAQGIHGTEDSVTFKVDVPKDGYYKYQMVYGAATGNDTWNLEKNNPKNAVQTLYADGKKVAEMLLPNTLSWYMSGMHTEYVYLTAGTHELKVEGTDSEGKASIDCMYLSYVGDEAQKQADQTTKVYEAEQSDFNVLGNRTTTDVTTETTKAGYSGVGYVTGLDTSVEQGGGIRFIAYAKENGLYDLTLDYASDEDATMNVYCGNTAKVLNNKIATVTAKKTDHGFAATTTTMYLEKGVNIIDVDASSHSLAVDKLTVAKAADQTSTTVVEAEDCKKIGDVTTGSNRYASNGTYINQIRGSKDASNALELSYNAKEDGMYALTIYQSNKELFGSHGYNAQMVDRYITLSVNGEAPTNAFFRNTYSDEAFKSQVVKVRLKKGDNTIKLYNDDTRVMKNGVGGVNTCTNYTPNIDKFEITPVVVNKAQVQGADLTVLNAVVSETKRLNKEDYTKKSFAKVEQLLQEAEALQASNPTVEEQQQVDELTGQLVRAVADLKPAKKQPAAKKASLNELKKAMKSAEKVDRKQYTEQSLETMDRAYNVAKELVAAKPNKAMQSVVDAATESLNQAIKNLELNEDNQIKKGDRILSCGMLYEVTEVAKGKEAVAVVGPERSNKLLITIPDTVKIEGTKFKVTELKDKAFKDNRNLVMVTVGKNVTSIGKECFANCKYLSEVILTTKELKVVGKNAFKGISKWAVIHVPNSKKDSYKKLLADKGQSSTVRIK